MEILLGGNCPAEIFPQRELSFRSEFYGLVFSGWESFEWELSGVNFPDGSFPGANYPVPSHYSLKNDEVSKDVIFNP